MTVEVRVGARWTALADPPFGTMFFDRAPPPDRAGPAPADHRLPAPERAAQLHLVYQARALDPTGTLANWSNPIQTELE